MDPLTAGLLFILPILLGTIFFESLFIWKVVPNLNALGYIATLADKYAPFIEQMEPQLENVVRGGRPQEGIMGFLMNTPIGHAIQKWGMGFLEKQGPEVIAYGP